MTESQPSVPPTPPAPIPAPPAPAAPAVPAPPAPSAFKPLITIDDFAKLDLRVATVLAAVPHPNADRLLKLQVDLGVEQRQICAGIRAYYPDPSVLVGQQIIVIANLPPRTLRGEISNGMVLAASAAQGDAVTDVVVLNPSRPVPAGSKIN